jgi:transcriptional regulator with XRE-family HTH domain
LAERLGVREETLANWERGQARPLPRHYGTIVRFLSYDPERVEDTLAGRLRAVRLRLGLTQEELAIRAGLDEGSVCRWESGSRRPCRWMAARVEAILDRLERDSAKFYEVEVSPHCRPDPISDLSFFDLTRWRRKPPTTLLPGKAATLGDQIRRRRLELGLSQSALGTRFGVGRVTVYRWERGDSPIPRSHRAEVERLLVATL